MNQSILFPDLQQWNSESQSMVFVAQSQGMNICCYISAIKLSKLAGLEVSSITNEQQAVLIFEQCRFDIEDLAEELIEAEDFDELGHIQLG